MHICYHLRKGQQKTGQTEIWNKQGTNSETKLTALWKQLLKESSYEGKDKEGSTLKTNLHGKITRLV